MFANFNLVEEKEKWRDEFFFCLIENKNEKIENVVCINLLLYHSYIKKKKKRVTNYIFIKNLCMDGHFL